MMYSLLNLTWIRSMWPVSGISNSLNSVSSGFMKTGSSEQTVLESFRRKKRSTASCFDSVFFFVIRAFSASFGAMLSFSFGLSPFSILVEEALGPFKKILFGSERSTQLM